MKSCPVCHANLFDDMPVCYGCMHSFSQSTQGGRSFSARPEAFESSLNVESPEEPAPATLERYGVPSRKETQVEEAHECEPFCYNGYLRIPLHELMSSSFDTVEGGQLAQIPLTIQVGRPADAVAPAASAVPQGKHQKS